MMSFSAKGLVKRYTSPDGEAFTAMGPIDLNVSAGEFLCLLGPTGCGKTTLLRILSGLEKPDEGSVDTDGRSMGYVFQQGALFPWMSVESNVLFPLKARGMNRDKSIAMCHDILQKVGLYSFRKSYPHELSGGMQQRTALARGLVTEPEFLLLDEPFASLDESTGMILQDVVHDLCQRLSITVVFVTHNIEEAVYLADRIVVMGSSPGRIVRDEPIPLRWPRNRISEPFTETLLSFRRTFEELVDPCLSAFSPMQEQHKSNGIQ